MKLHCFWKSILLYMILATFCSCSKTETGEEYSPSTEIPKMIEGCEIKNPGTALLKGVLKADYIYIYGSRKTGQNEPEKLWIAQYSLQHELLKEYVETVDNLSLSVMKMTPVSGGKYLITSNSNNPQKSFEAGDVIEQIPAILDPSKGVLKITRIKKGFFFDVINNYENFILLSLSNAEFDKNPTITPSECPNIQINYDGKVLFSSTKFRIPAKSDSLLWISNSEYITASLKEVCSTFLDGTKKDKWKHTLDAPAQSVIEMATAGDNTKVEYRYVDRERKKNKIYIFDLGTGQQKIVAEKISTIVKNSEIVLTGNKELDLKAQVLPINTFLNHLKYESSDPTVATITENGILKTHKNGNSVIYICSEDGFAEQEIQLAVSSLSFVHKNNEIMVGKSKQLEIIADEKISYNDLLWKSSDENVACVDERGEVIGLRKGKTTITVSSKGGEMEASCLLEVKDFMDYVDLTTNFSFIGSDVIGSMALSVSIFNKSDDDAEVVTCSFCYEEDSSVVNLAENKELTSKNVLELLLPTFTVYPVKKPYVKLEMRHKDKVYEAKYSISVGLK